MSKSIWGNKLEESGGIKQYQVNLSPDADTEDRVEAVANMLLVAARGGMRRALLANNVNMSTSSLVLANIERLMNTEAFSGKIVDLIMKYRAY